MSLYDDCCSDINGAKHSPRRFRLGGPEGRFGTSNEKSNFSFFSAFVECLHLRKFEHIVSEHFL